MSRGMELMKSTGVLAFGKICTQFVSFFLLPLYTALLVPSEYGVFNLLNTVVLLLIPVVGWQTDQGAFRLLIDCRNNRSNQSVVMTTVSLLNVCQCIAYAVALSIIYLLCNFDYFVFLLINLILNVFTASLLQFARGMGKNSVYAMGSFLSGACAVIGNVMLLVVIPMGLNGMLLALNISQCISIIYIVLSLKIWKYIKTQYYRRATANEILRYSLPLVPNNLCWWAISMAGTLIVTSFLGTSANGIYSVAGKFSSAFISIYNVFNLSWSEVISVHINDDDLTKFFSNIFEMIYSLFFWACALVIAVIPFIFSMLVDQSYNSAYIQIPILMIGALAQVFVGLLSAIYIALKKTKEIAKTSFYAAIVSIVTALALVGIIGIAGVSLGTFLAFVVMSVYRYHDVKRRIDFRFNSRLLWLNISILSISLVGYLTEDLAFEIAGLVLVLVGGYFVNRRSIKAARREIGAAVGTRLHRG